MNVTVNGDTKALDDDATIADLIRLLALEGKRIAVELNMEIVPRSEHAVTILHQGDNLEIVHAIGGG
ncbi:sulfur carrier protein ThiS [Alkalimarinus sediminis]|uniref:sulfur carrier protein ThiS n=1 Tax=Alkalimarinus sediminis TaxID=1632866 RepID=UPI00255AEB28|nr:sulfur carrier protein ThiS [Alkalimarinus sediminis]